MADKELGIVLRAKGAAAASQQIKGVDNSLGRLTNRAGTFATQLKTNVSHALTTFGGRLKQVIGAGVGFLGIGGILGFTAALTKGISKAQEWGAASLRLALLTKLPIEMTSRLIDALDYFGISAETQTTIAAKFEKALGGIAEFSAAGAKKVAEWNKHHSKSITIAQKLALEYPKIVAFQKQFGLQLVDSKGHLLDYNAQLLASADYFNDKNIPANKKALALSKLYGKTWTDLIPILSQGRAGILKAEQDAMHMSQADLDAITANKKATREWDDALGDLETQIGIKLLPTLTEMMTGAARFLQGHSDEIITFVQGAVSVAKGAVSTIVGVAEELGGLWEKIPAPLRDFVLKAAIGEKVIKFLFGVSPVEIAVKGIEKGLSQGVGEAVAKAGIGKAFVQPVFVTNMGAGGMGGGVGGAAAAAGGMGLLAGGLALTGVAAALVGLGELIRQQLHPTTSGELLQQFSAAEARAYHSGRMSVEQITASRSGPGQTRVTALLQDAAEKASQARNAAHTDQTATKSTLATKTDAVRTAVAASATSIVSALRSLDLTVHVNVHGSGTGSFTSNSTTNTGGGSGGIDRSGPGGTGP